MIVKVKKNKDHYIIIDTFDNYIYPEIYHESLTAQIAADKIEKKIILENKYNA